jgi:hypothetical protein
MSSKYDNVIQESWGSCLVSLFVDRPLNKQEERVDRATLAKLRAGVAVRYPVCSLYPRVLRMHRTAQVSRGGLSE